MAFVAYLLCAGLGYLAETYLPYSDASPYIALMLSYHLFLCYLIVAAWIRAEQKIGLSMPLPVALITHSAFIAAQVGIVMGRQYVPLFMLLKFLVPGLAPFEVKWVFEGSTAHKSKSSELAPMPSGTHEEYSEFLVYLKQSNRKFLRADRSVHEEFAVWQKHHHKKRALAAAAEGSKSAPRR
ncbi:MAG TPA: hypothetical protein VGJ21_16100 [Terracidiphilus sp.]|jgi:hypothetical protein